jgi:hypothetical protein
VTETRGIARREWAVGPFAGTEKEPLTVTFLASPSRSSKKMPFNPKEARIAKAMSAGSMSRPVTSDVCHYPTMVALNR